MSDPKTPPTLSDRLATLGKHKDDPIMQAAAVFAEADEALRQAGVFFEKIHLGDTLGIEFLATSMNRAQAVRTWFAPWLRQGSTLAQAWEFWLSKVSFLAKQEGNRIAPLAGSILEVIELCSENELLFMQLKETLFIFERPCRMLRTKDQVSAYLGLLVNRGYAERTQIAPRWKAINWEGTYYFPKRNLRVATIGWESVVLAVSRVRNQSRKEEELLKRLEPLLDQSTLPLDVQGQGLSRLLRGDVTGSITIWDANSRFGGKETGLIAVTLGRFVLDPNLPIVLLGIIADTQLAEVVTSKASDDGFDLPPILLEQKDDGGLRATFGRLSGLDWDTHQAMMRIEHLIQFRINQENKPQPPTLPAPQPLALPPTKGVNS